MTAEKSGEVLWRWPLLGRQVEEEKGEKVGDNIGRRRRIRIRVPMYINVCVCVLYSYVVHKRVMKSSDDRVSLERIRVKLNENPDRYNL